MRSLHKTRVRGSYRKRLFTGDASLLPLLLRQERQHDMDGVWLPAPECQQDARFPACYFSIQAMTRIDSL